jgi:RNA polymerase sigma-70 factor (ECF subfamily)
MTESPSSLSLIRLISRARVGSDAAFGILFQVYRGYLHLLAEMQISQQLQGKIDASDAVQEAFLRIRAGFGEFRGSSEGELVVWLRRILARVLVDQMRCFAGTAKRSVQLERRLNAGLGQSSHSLQQAFPSPISSPSQQASRREEAVLVADALERLPSHYRAVIILRSFEDKTFPEIAQEMQRSVTSVKKLWPRALMRLQQELKEK